MNHEKIYEDLQPQLAALEDLRSECRRKSKVAYYFFAGAILPVAGFHYFLGSETAKPWTFLGVVLFVIGGAIYAKQVKRYETEVKRQIIPVIVGTISPGVNYDGAHHVEETEYNNSRLFPRADRYRGEDLLHGKLGATDFKISEIHTQRRRKTKNKTKYTTLFKGVFMVADFHKHFNGRTQVLPDTAERLFGHFLGRKMQKTGRQGMELVELEDVDFEKEFAVYSSDQTEARYILSTSLMRRILQLKQSWDSNIYLSFSDGKIYLAIRTTKDFFKVNFYKPITVQKIWVYLEELLACLDMIEELNLNLRIWSKE